MSTAAGLSYKETAEVLTSFLEIVIHTILCIRNVYPAHTFTRRRAHSVPVYQSRHPQVRQYVAEVCALIGKEMDKGNVRRVTIVIKSMDGLPLERFLVDMGYLGLDKIGGNKEAQLVGAPTADDLSLLLRGFLIRLTALDSQLLDNQGEVTYAIIVETNDDLEPSSNHPTDGVGTPAPQSEDSVAYKQSVPPWIPAMAADTLRPPEPGCPAEQHEPLLHVKAVETGVIDIRLMVQECVAKTGVEHLQITS